MSGPIVRKYGFPNFDEIFGKKELQHGVDDPSTAKPAEGGSEAKNASKDEKPAQPPTKS